MTAMHFIRLLMIVSMAGLLLGTPLDAMAQETDTTKISIDQDEEGETSLQLDQQYSRSVSGGALTEMGTYNVPNSTQYYHAPFEAQNELDRAVEAYRKEMEKNWYWHFLRAVSPYIRLHLGVRDFNTLQIVGRDNPLFQSYTNNDKRQ
jgi:hypothetical protein